MAITACSDMKIANDSAVDALEVSVDVISEEMAVVRDYIPAFAVAAHRGSTFWVPEETEAAYRWAREIGADYLEADLQVSKDGVLLSLHDDDLSRTTDIEVIYGEYVPSTRAQYYMDLGYSESEANEKVVADKASFIPYYASFYTYSELLALDAGTWFNDANPEQARDAFSSERQYISTLQDMIMYSKGKRLKRDENGDRVWEILGIKTGETVSSLSGEADVVEYYFEYEDDDVWSGNVPGLYLEFKAPWLCPGDFEERVYDELAKYDMNIIESPADGIANYVDNKVNVGNANGKVILQTFSFSSLVRVDQNFKGQVPMCLLLWESTDDIQTALGFASYINLAVQYNAHIIGPSIAGEPNNYSELNAPWQAYLIKKAGLLNHPYSFDTLDQMKQYFGEWYDGVTGGTVYEAPYFDGLFTNRAEVTLQYLIDAGVREAGAPTTVPDSKSLLDSLGY